MSNNIAQKQIGDSAKLIVNAEADQAKVSDAFIYQLLARLKQDCDYYLGSGNGANKHLWAGNEAEQIAKMKELYSDLREKPEWLSLEDISFYEARMLSKHTDLYKVLQAE